MVINTPKINKKCVSFLNKTYSFPSDSWTRLKDNHTCSICETSHFERDAGVGGKSKICQGHRLLPY